MRLACWRAYPRNRGLSFCCLHAQRMRNLAKRSFRRDAETSTRDVCATQTSSPRDDTEPPSLPYRLRGIVFHWAARGIEPAPRPLHSHRHRDDAGRRKPEFDRILAFGLARYIITG